MRSLKIEMYLELQVKCHSKDKAHLVDGTMVEFKDLFGLGLEDLKMYKKMTYSEQM